MSKLYTYKAVDSFIDKMVNDHGYEAIRTDEGGCGSGNWVLVAPDDKHWNYVIREVYLNEWSSAHTCRKCRKISTAVQKEIDAAYEREREEEREYEEYLASIEADKQRLRCSI